MFRSAIVPWRSAVFIARSAVEPLLRLYQLALFV